MKNPNVAAVLRGLVACYLIYLGVTNLRNLAEANYNPVIIAFSVLFIVFGAGYLYYTYREAQKSANADDDMNASKTPDTAGNSGISEESDTADNICIEEYTEVDDTVSEDEDADEIAYIIEDAAAMEDAAAEEAD